MPGEPPLNTRPTVVVRGIDRLGRTHVECPVPHGGPPRRVLRQAGFKATHPTRAHWVDAGTFVIEFCGYPATWSGRPCQDDPHTATDATEAVTADRVLQRVAAYGLVFASAGPTLAEDSILLTSLSGRIRRPGLWILPGGGVERQECPRDALAREAWEEAGQDVTVEQLVAVASGHRIGPTQGGQVEDFHAIRLIYRAQCPQPSDPVVYDQDGSTQDAVWWPVREMRAGRFPGTVAPWVQQALRDATGADFTAERNVG